MVDHRKKRRFFTLMIIPHTEESIFSIRIPLLLLQTLGIILLIVLLIFFLWVKSYHQLKGGVAETTNLKAINRNLRAELDKLTRETEDLREKIVQIEELSREICALMNFTPKGETEEVYAEKRMLLAYSDSQRYLPARGENMVLERAALNLAHVENAIPKLNEELQQLKEDVEAHQRKMAATPSIWPTRGRVTSEFGPRRSPTTRRWEYHFGIDIAGPRGTPVVSTADGLVVFSAYRLGYGNTIIIKHGYDFQTVYAHLKSFNVSAGNTVKKGQVIGYMGSSGQTTGVHLHYEVHYNGVAVDPRKYLP